MINVVNTIDVKELDSWDTWTQDLIDFDGEITPLTLRSVDAIYRYLIQGYTYQIQYSSGKDSETVLGLFLLALMRAKREGKAISNAHFLVHVDTGIDNPEIRNLAQNKINSLDSFIMENSLPLVTYIAHPSLSSTWASRVLGGRGLPTFVSSKFRQCTHELKITGANRVVSKHTKLMSKEQKAKLIMLLGSRDLEGTIRKNNIAKMGGDDIKISKSGNKYSLYPIKTWSSANVWEYLTYSGNRPSSVLPSYLEDHYQTVDIYRDSGAGECVVFQADTDTDGGAGQSSCGSRHGCVYCLASPADKSMLTLLETDPERYGYMTGLNRVQRYLELTRYNWEMRHPVGRTINNGGYIKIQPDVYSPAVLKRLLHAILSFDYLEQKRAANIKQKVFNGTLPETEYNLRMSEPQFQIIDERQLIAIEMLWSLHHFQKRPFEALDIWHQVYTDGELELLEEVDSMVATPKTPQPAPFWLHVGEWGDNSGLDGLSDNMTEFAYFDSYQDQTHRLVSTKEGLRRVVDYVESELFDVDIDAAKFIVQEEYTRLRPKAHDGYYTPYYAAAYLLRFGAVQLGKGQAARYHEMAQRGQTYHSLGLTGQLSMSEIANNPKYQGLILDNKAYKVLAAELKIEQDKAAELEAIREKNEQRIAAKRKAWAKANPKLATIAKSLKKETSMQRHNEQLFKSLFIMATSIHAEIQVDTISGKLNSDKLPRRLKVLNGLRNEISSLREIQTEKYIQKGYKHQLEMNEKWLNILESGNVDTFESDHLADYARIAPAQFKQELRDSIQRCKESLTGWYTGAGHKAPCTQDINIVIKVNEKAQVEMDLSVFLAA
ncbi:TPA: phosphoadenosine phosphosulfate reductase family protein [Vibrio cholerae O1]|nr:phosphoadenosine phosphosulfate reductase family protein [Vibrio cholerae]